MNDAEAIGSWDPPPLDTPHGLLTFGAQFAKVAVDADLGIIRVRHMTGAFAPGRVLNPKTARSQLMGGMLWGLSQALLEGTRMDTSLGRWANASLGDYLVAVNADAPDVDVELIEVDDQVAGPLGVKGIGRSARSAPRPRSPTRSTTPPATGPANCRSPSSTCWPPCHPGRRPLRQEHSRT